MSTEMKMLIIGGTEYEIVDDAGRTRITALEQGTVIGGGLSQIEKDYILELFEKAAYADNGASEAFNALSALWADSTVYHAIAWSGTGYTKSNSAASVTAGGTFTSTITANTGFTLTNVAVTMGGNTVQGAWSNGTVTIPNVTGDIVITVTTAQITVSSISAAYTQSGTVYDTDTLDSLKTDLVVTATFMDNTTGVISAADYTLSGTLTEGTSTITVAYGGKTTTFNVTVEEAPLDTTAQLDTEHINKGQSATGGTYTNKTDFCPTIKYAINPSGNSYDYIRGIIPVDVTAGTTCRVWFYDSNDDITVGSGYGSGKPIQVYDASTMTEGTINVNMSNNPVAFTIPVHVDYLADAYLYLQSSGDVIFAGANTPYYGKSNISEVST